MGGFACAHAEKRHRLDRTLNGLGKKGYVGSCYAKDAKYKPFSFGALLSEGLSGKMLYVKLVLLILMCGSIMGLLHSPSIHHGDNHRRSTQSPEMSTAMRTTSGADEPDSGYTSDLRVDWSRVSMTVQQVAREGDGGLRVGILYQEWIDEEELSNLPDPSSAPEGGYDVVAVELQCSGAAGWSKDVPRLHLQLAAGRSEEHGRQAAHVIVVGRIFPAPNLFRCKVMRDDDVWLYRPDLSELRQKLALPTGSCRLAMPFRTLGTNSIRTNTCLCHNTRTSTMSLQSTKPPRGPHVVSSLESLMGKLRPCAGRRVVSEG